MALKREIKMDKDIIILFKKVSNICNKQQDRINLLEKKVNDLIKFTNTLKNGVYDFMDCFKEK